MLVRYVAVYETSRTTSTISLFNGQLQAVTPENQDMKINNAILEPKSHKMRPNFNASKKQPFYTFISVKPDFQIVT